MCNVNGADYMATERSVTSGSSDGSVSEMCALQNAEITGCNGSAA